MSKLKEEEAYIAKPYSPTGYELLVQKHLQKRLPILKKSKKKILGDIDFEQIMKDADREYTPRSLREKAESSTGVYLESDDLTGLRGARIVNISGKEGATWRSDVSEPTLFIKIQTALSILVDQNPEAVFKAIGEKYQETTKVAEAIWKRSWEVADSREQLKLFIFDLAKYGWAIGRTYPRLVERKGEILTEVDTENPENNKYDEVTITEFNDVYREKLDPYRTWIDDMTNLTNPWSTGDWYFEQDFDRDTFDQLFGDYENSDKVSFGSKSGSSSNDEAEIKNEETSERDDIITLGFYESKNKDLYAIWCPKDEVVVYHSPNPNDDKMLSCWFTYWNIRDPRTPYGVGMFEMIKNNKVLFDRLNNMTMDELILAVYKMFFFSGPALTGDGTIVVSPGVAHQKLPGTSIDTVDFKFDSKHWEGVDRAKESIDEVTGISPTLQGEVAGKTLGETLYAKDFALRRLNIPLSNISEALNDDAYLTLSWANQLYTLPEVKEFLTTDQLEDFSRENGIEPSETRVDETTGKITADFPRSLELGLSEDRDGTLIESADSRFFTVGSTTLPKKSIKWKGRITVRSQSILSTSQELERQRKLELYNLVAPGIQSIAQAMQQGMARTAVVLAKPIVQILEIQNEKPENWLPGEIVDLLDNPELAGEIETESLNKMKEAEAAAAAGPEDNALFTTPGDPSAPSAPVAPSEAGPAVNKEVPTTQITNPVRESMDAMPMAPQLG
jgi:hypothetical protein